MILVPTNQMKRYILYSRDPFYGERTAQFDTIAAAMSALAVYSGRIIIKDADGNIVLKRG